MRKRAITIAGGNRVSIPSYIRAVNMARQNPETRFERGLTQWWACTGADIFAQYIEGVHDRINQAVKNRNL